jgi:hypothetical protein
MIDLTPNDAAIRNDRAAQLALMLARELWVVKDRLMVLEAVLGKDGQLRDAVDRHVMEGVDKSALDAERARFIAEIMAALQAPGDRP